MEAAERAVRAHEQTVDSVVLVVQRTKTVGITPVMSKDCVCLLASISELIAVKGRCEASFHEKAWLTV
ncbi:hypothetical protein CCR75_001951 [Bremia lactucae]|uniref:Uncharacterized protein n=1 Tax=Bremia lactucae TaxID=4779 RepID=A0A976IDJ5_BRELC|nr:hypothetical protein CCR75_001951 [Bremia lactucae]